MNDASALMSPLVTPRDNKTLITLRTKHPTYDPAAITTGIAQAVQRAGTNAADEKANVTG